MHRVLHPKRFLEKLRGNLKGCQLEVRSQRAPKLLVSNKIVVDSGVFQCNNIYRWCKSEEGMG